MTPDSRPSIAGMSFPPSYSVALTAPVLSMTADEDDKLLETQSFVENDGDSLQLVTLDFDPPPSYTEALSLIEQKEQTRSARDVGVQSDYTSMFLPSSNLSARESHQLFQRSRSSSSLPPFEGTAGRKSRSLCYLRPESFT
ncbi:unnamed protein product [Soboliphyme baturini]|uniref:Uncharacterized protein n=1 Tax=Soboliphyme baturini TaxID=241478 RepID=A0A183J6R2_9BILA|nr:unnamed protein product [Soboliphyme baturini]